jgi:hypothetical protein
LGRKGKLDKAIESGDWSAMVDKAARELRRSAGQLAEEQLAEPEPEGEDEPARGILPTPPRKSRGWVAEDQERLEASMRKASVAHKPQEVPWDEFWERIEACNRRSNWAGVSSPAGPPPDPPPDPGSPPASAAEMFRFKYRGLMSALIRAARSLSSGHHRSRVSPLRLFITVTRKNRLDGRNPASPTKRSASRIEFGNGASKKSKPSSRWRASR